MVNTVTVTYTPPTGTGAEAGNEDFIRQARSAWVETPLIATKMSKLPGAGLFDYKIAYTVPGDEKELERWNEHTLVELPTPQSTEDFVHHILDSPDILSKVQPNSDNYGACMYLGKGTGEAEYHFCFINCHAIFDARGYYKVSA